MDSRGHLLAGRATLPVGAPGPDGAGAGTTLGSSTLGSREPTPARVVLRRTGLRRVLDGASGAVLVGFGARLALQQR